MKNQTLLAADNIRILALAMVEKAKSGHPGGAMGGADFINVLYSEFLRYDPANTAYPWRDRFFLDPGHMSPMLYATLALAGYYSPEDLQNFRQWGSVTPGHPERDLAHAVENTSGPLGQGHAMALGAAVAERFLAARFGEWTGHKTYAYISDGGIQEEVSQGVGRIAGHLGLSNFIMYYDANNVQLSTTVEEVDTEDVAAKYRAWEWNVLKVNGCDADEIRDALKKANAETQRPTLIIGKTVMGKGARDLAGESFENRVSTHGQPLSAAGAHIENTIKNLGGDPEHPFAIFPEAKELYAKRRAELEKWAAGRADIEKRWRAENSELAAKLDLFLSGKTPKIDYDAIDPGKDSATRNASATVLGVFGEKVENMIVSSADLSNSDKTDGFLKKTRALKKGDFSGRFFQAGVSEFTMACVMNGMALHGGVIPVCGTFFVFSDYMKPAVRIAALQRLHVVWVWSHDSFRVGEDGPTHQPIEQEAQIRLMEQLRNHDGDRSTIVLRPADGAETIEAWRYAVEADRPVALILSRQNIKDLPSASGSRRTDARQLAKGAYVVYRNDALLSSEQDRCCADRSSEARDSTQCTARAEEQEGATDALLSRQKPQAIMIADGSEVATLVEGAEKLAADGIRVRIVSAPSEGLFRDQPIEYQNEVIPQGIVRFGLTSGLPITLRGLLGDGGEIHGLDHFGYSAPYKVLDEKFGFSGETVYNKVKKLLGR